MEIKVKLFGPARTAARVDEVTVSVRNGVTVRELRDAVAAAFPMLESWLSSGRLAVNEAFADVEAVVSDGDEIALIPPVSGGGGACESEPILVALSPEPIDVTALFRQLAGDTRCGGRCCFEGVTRSEDDATHGELTHLEYESYDAMALRQMERLAERAMSEFGAFRVVVVHRLGTVPPGEASVFVGASSPHRAEAFSACRWLIDTLKKEVPIWKREVFADGHARWSDPSCCAGPSNPDMSALHGSPANINEPGGKE